ncbi:MAG TPA: VOC family protein [Gammaproteobacteria bacterium]|jgi:catechol-2,3-dioxygenase
MAVSPPATFSLSLSHFELYVRDIAAMEDFYTRYLGFEVTDRGHGAAAMVFLSRNPRAHHQLVLNPLEPAAATQSPVDHIAFRVGTLTALKSLHAVLTGSPAELQTVSHGNSWSLYFRDPEGNRLELFTDTPWHVDQPCRFEIDLGLDEPALREFTENAIRDLPGFGDAGDWRQRRRAMRRGERA